MKILAIFLSLEAFSAGIRVGNWATIHNEKKDFDEVWRNKMIRDYHQVNKIVEKLADVFILAEDTLSMMTDKIKGNKN